MRGKQRKYRLCLKIQLHFYEMCKQTPLHLNDFFSLYWVECLYIFFSPFSGTKWLSIKFYCRLPSYENFVLIHRNECVSKSMSVLMCIWPSWWLFWIVGIVFHRKSRGNIRVQTGTENIFIGHYLDYMQNTCNYFFFYFIVCRTQKYFNPILDFSIYDEYFKYSKTSINRANWDRWYLAYWKSSLIYKLCIKTQI